MTSFCIQEWGGKVGGTSEAEKHMTHIINTCVCEVAAEAAEAKLNKLMFLDSCSMLDSPSSLCLFMSLRSSHHNVVVGQANQTVKTPASLPASKCRL